ncbi:hypothetical protein ACGGZK_02345 [Agromyces sp. MMS24-K17]|uniref:hypothetical protein n=1 Tax=Agromyces sp. MMS24-K17 TaxID=3372850 RepID=UPI0037543AF9
MKAFFAVRVPLWLVLVVTVGIVVAAPFLTPVVANALSALHPDSDEVRVVDAITREEQVVLLSLGVHDLEKADEKGRILAWDIPASERVTYLEYAFTASLGIDGSEVRIERTGDGAYLVSIPEFIFIGHSDVDFGEPIEQAGGLSLFAPEIDELQMAEDILDQDATEHYVDAFREILEDQAAVFYRGIITSIDPTLVVEFEFAR